MIYNKPKKILGVGDIHFFNSKRFDEHRHVLNNFYSLLDVEKPDLILIGGDVVDSKLRLSPEQIEMCRDFLMNLANTCPVIMIPGNHDVNLQNKERLDSLTPFVNSLINEVTYPIHYLKNSGLYNIRLRKESHPYKVQSTKQAVTPPSINPKDLRVKEIRTLLNYPLDLVKEWLHSQNVTSPSELDSSKIDELVKTMCLAWAENKFGHPNHAANSYQKYVVDIVASGVDETTAIRTWISGALAQLPALN